jgi:hypothetical protein
MGGVLEQKAAEIAKAGDGKLRGAEARKHGHWLRPYARYVLLWCMSRGSLREVRWG